MGMWVEGSGMILGIRLAIFSWEPTTAKRFSPSWQRYSISADQKTCDIFISGKLEKL